jgi:hypothetical protein
VLDEVAAAVPGQSRPPAVFLMQTGGAYSNETNSVPQAQLEAGLEIPGCYLAAPVYPVTDKGGHLDANGYRWLGAQFGKVMHRVLTLGQDWRPLYPLRATVAGDVISVLFHVPVPPLAWGRPFQGHKAKERADKGFAVLDEQGPIPIRAVALSGADEVEITLERPPGADVLLRYADRARGGQGCLHDSDGETASCAYEYAEGRGHLPSANIAELIGRPYGLENWCAAFAIPVRPDRSRPGTSCAAGHRSPQRRHLPGCNACATG